METATQKTLTLGFHFLLLGCLSALGQPVDTLERIRELESKRDPKCFATAVRVEDFMYGTPLSTAARERKIELQKQLVVGVWRAASAVAAAEGAREVQPAHLGGPLRGMNYAKTEAGGWRIELTGGESLELSARDSRHYFNIAYAVRAILAVQQEALFADAAPLPLARESLLALETFLNVQSLATLRLADTAARRANEFEISPARFEAAWNQVSRGPTDAAPLAPSAPPLRRFDTIHQIVAQKVAAFDAYNQLSNEIFQRNIQVYFARHKWAAGKEESNRLKSLLMESLIAFTKDLWAGFDTIILKENNLRLLFNDTSVAPFPANMWRLIANDTASGGASHFSIEDATAAVVPFRLDAGAPADALRISSTGKLGLRTAAPVLDLHIATSNTPAIRMEQSNAGGFTAQTWDVAGNEANFFIRDVTGGSRLPFRIRPGAPTSSIDISANGSVGMGTGSPKAKLHVSLKTMAPDNEGVLIADTMSMVTTNAATLHVEGTALITQTLEVGSSRETKEEIKDLTLDEAMGALTALKPVHFKYKTSPEHQLGFIAEDVPDLVATDSRKSLVPMDFIAVLTKVVQQHETRERELEKTVAAQQELLNTLSSRLAAVERRAPAGLTAAAATASAARQAERARYQDRPEAEKPAPPVQTAPPAPRPVVLDNGR